MLNLDNILDTFLI